MNYYLVILILLVLLSMVIEGVSRLTRWLMSLLILYILYRFLVVSGAIPSLVVTIPLAMTRLNQWLRDIASVSI